MVLQSKKSEVRNTLNSKAVNTMGPVDKVATDIFRDLCMSLIVLSALLLLIANPLTLSILFEITLTHSIYLLCVDFSLMLAGILLPVQYIISRRIVYFYASVALLILIPVLCTGAEITIGYLRSESATSAYHELSATSAPLFVPHRDYGWVHPSGARISDSTPFFEATYVTDYDGRKFIPSVADPTQTLHFFGDSFIFGYGVDNSDTALNILANEGGFESRVKVLNYGVAGYGLEQVFARFSSAAKNIHSGDVVVFALISDDLERNLIQKVYVCNHILHFGAGVTRFPLWRRGEWQSAEIWRECSYPLSLLGASGLPLGGLYRRLIQKYHERFSRELLLKNAAGIFDQAADLTKTKGASFAVLYLPRDVECLSGSIRMLATDGKAKVHSLLPACPDDPSEIKRLFFGDGHWNKAGNHWAARALFDWLVSEKLIMDFGQVPEL